MKFIRFCWIVLLFYPVLAQDEPHESGPGKLSIEKKTYKAIEGKSETIKIIRTGGSDGTVSVRVKTTDGSATPGSDYAVLDQIVTFAEGEHEQSVTVKFLGDNALELPESVGLALSDLTGGATLGANPKSKFQIVMIKNDGVVFGMLFTLLAIVFVTAANPKYETFYKFVPSLLLCYFLPSLLTTAGIVSEDHSRIYFVASRFLLPACLVLLCLSLDLKGILRLGPKAVIMFLTGTFGIVFGGPLALLIVGAFSPETVAGEFPNEVWRGMTTVAGSWIGGGANQAAMFDTFDVGGQIFSATVTVDIIVASLWMAVLLLLAGESDKVDKKFLKADNSAIKELQQKLADYQEQTAKIPKLSDVMMYAGVAFAITAVGHFLADIIGPLAASNPTLAEFSLGSKFFWLIVISSCGGVILSFTKAREWEGLGASRLGSAFLYVLVASIGMKMDLMAIFHYPGLFVIGAIWIAFHGFLMIAVARIIKAPLFFMAVGSQANVGGAASAPIVASAFHPTLAPVGVMLAVLGYFLGTFCAYGCGLIMKFLMT